MPTIQGQRTQLESPYTVNLNKVAESLRENGYEVKTMKGGTLSVTSPDLSDKNEIRITRKNAYIERADYEAPEIGAVYEKMKQSVIQAMKDDFANEEKKVIATLNSPMLNGIHSQTILREMISELKKDAGEKDYGDLFQKPKLEYSFKDEKGQDFISIKAEYHLNEQDQVEPAISFAYGEKYGNYKESLTVSKEDFDALEKDELYFTDLAKRLDNLCKVGTRERSENVQNLNYDGRSNYDGTRHIELIPNKDSTALPLEVINQRKEGRNQNILEQNPNAIMSQVDFGKMEIKKEGIVVKDESLPNEPKWIQGVVQLCHQMEDFRNGPVQDLLNAAKEMKEGMFYEDKMLSGIKIEIGDIRENFREGFGYGKMVSEMEKQAKELLSSENKELRLQGIDRKIDAQVLRDSFHEHYNAFSKTAFRIQELSDRVLSQLKAVVRDASVTGHAMTKAPLDNLKGKFQESMSEIAVRVREAKMLLTQIGKDMKEFGVDQIGTASRTQTYLMDHLKDGYNTTVDMANAQLSSKKYTQEVIAEKINDDALLQKYENCSYKEFMKTTAPRFWSEIDATVKRGKELEKIPEEDRSVEDTSAIKLGQRAENQKVQTWAIAEELQKKVPEFMTSKTMTKDQAVDDLAKTYYETKSMVEGSAHSYQALSEAEKAPYKELMGNLLQVMPDVEKHLEKNSIAPDRDVQAIGE